MPEAFRTRRTEILIGGFCLLLLVVGLLAGRATAGSGAPGLHSAQVRGVPEQELPAIVVPAELEIPESLRR